MIAIDFSEKKSYSNLAPKSLTNDADFKVRPLSLLDDYAENGGSLLTLITHRSAIAVAFT